MDLAVEIEKMKQTLIHLADKKADPLKDPEIYEQSCLIDLMIVAYYKGNGMTRGTYNKKCR